MVAPPPLLTPLSPCGPRSQKPTTHVLAVHIQRTLLSSARVASDAVGLHMQVRMKVHLHAAQGNEAHHAGELCQHCCRTGKHAETEGVHHAVELRIAKRQCRRVTCVQRHFLRQLDRKSPESGRYCLTGTAGSLCTFRRQSSSGTRAVIGAHCGVTLSHSSGQRDHPELSCFPREQAVLARSKLASERAAPACQQQSVQQTLAASGHPDLGGQQTT